MRIEKLTLSAFRSFTNVELSTAASRVLIAGVNGTGKTSIRESIKWALTGRCQGLDGKGAGAEVLTPFFGPQPGASVSVELAGIGRVTRTAKNGTGSFSVQGFSGTGPTQQAALYSAFETTPAFLDAVLDTETFLRLHHSDAKALVLALLNVTIALGEEPNSPVYSLAELDQLYGEAFEERKLAKRQLQQNGMPPKPSDDPHPSVAAVTAQLQKLRSDLEAAVERVGDTSGARAVLQRQLQALMRPVPQPSLGSFASIDAMSERRLDLEERLSIVEADAAETEPPMPPLTPPIEPAVVDVVVLRRRSDALKAHKPTKGCVLDPSVPCKTPKAEFSRAAKTLDAEMVTAPAAAPTEPREASPLVAELKTLNDLSAKYDRWLLDEERRRDKLAGIEAELQSLPDTAEHDTVIAGLKTRIQKGEQILKQAQAHEAATVAYDRALENRATLQAEVERLETVVATLGPNGVRVKALEQAIGKFAAQVNVYTERFGWHLTFNLDQWMVLANERPVETYSKSEQFRIGIAFQLAIAALSGLGFAVIDELDMLDYQNRGLVTQMVMQAPLDQVFVIGTREPGIALPTSSQIVAYRLGQQDGRTVVLERTGSTSLAA